MNTLETETTDSPAQRFLFLVAIILACVTALLILTGRWPGWPDGATWLLGALAVIWGCLISAYAPRGQKLSMVSSMVGVLGCFEVGFQLEWLYSRVSPGVSASILYIQYVVGAIGAFFIVVLGFQMFRYMPFTWRTKKSS